MTDRTILEDHAPEMAGSISCVLFPGGEDQPGRIEGESVLANYHGKVVGWFTVRKTTSSGDHPDFAKQAWGGVPLAVRSRYYTPGDEVVGVLAVDAFNGLADNRASEEVLEYWATEFSSYGDQFRAEHLPVLSFVTSDGLLEPNPLLEQ